MKTTKQNRRAIDQVQGYSIGTEGAYISFNVGSVTVAQMVAGAYRMASGSLRNQGQAYCGTCVVMVTLRDRKIINIRYEANFGTMSTKAAVADQLAKTARQHNRIK